MARKMGFRLASNVNAILMSFFLNSFRSLGPRICTHGNFIIFLVFFLLFWLLLFGLLMFCKYSVAMLVGVFLLCPFSVKMAIKKSVSLWRPFQYIFCMLMIKTFKHSHYNIWCYVWVWFYLYICYWSFPNDFEIRRVINSVCDSCIKEIELLVFIFEFIHVLYWGIFTVQDV